MAFEYELPDVGEGVAEGEIIRWLVEPGDAVSEDEVLAEVETDKAVVDLPSPVNGVVRELHAEAGDIVPVGSVVVTLDVDGDAEAVDPESADDATTEPAPTGDSGAEEQAGASSAASVPDGRVFAPPNVRRLARELGVDLTTVDGSGPGGRITDGDVRAAASDEPETPTPSPGAPDDGTSDGDGQPRQVIEGGGTDAAPSTVDGTGTTGVERTDRDRTLAAPATRQLARELDVDIDAIPTDKTKDGEAFVEPEDVELFAEGRVAAAKAPAEPASTAGTVAVDADAQGVAFAEGEREHREPYRGVRRTIGRQMSQSAFTAPHATHHDTAEVSALVDARSNLRERADEQGVRLTYMPFIMKAIVAGLREHPVLNTELDEEAEEIIYKNYYNVGIAVATDVGLMVPVVKHVDQKSIVDLAREVNDLVERARNRKVTPEEMSGSTFTITNFGAIGGEYATPIINHPETAILGLGTIKQRPVVEAGEVVARHTLPLSLSIDHRVIDGADGAQFCNTVIEYLENPTLLLLE